MNEHEQRLLRITGYCDTDAEIIDALKRHAALSRDLFEDACSDLFEVIDRDRFHNELCEIQQLVRPAATVNTHYCTATALMSIGLMVATAWQKVATQAIDEDPQAIVHHVRYLKAKRDGAIEQAEKLEDARCVA